MRIGAAVIALVSCLLMSAPGSSGAEEAASPQPYSGAWLERSTLTGDWNNGRNTLADKGVTVEASLTQVGQGVVDGGKSHDWEYGGRFNLTERFDTEKMGLWPGGFLTVQLDANWNKAINQNTGALVPASSMQLYPWPGSDNVNISELSYLQFLSHYFGVQLGKMETIANGDANAFAHGRGDTQFLNLAFNINPLLVVAVPYSTLGAAAIILPTQDPNDAIVTLSVVQTNGSSREIGFDDLDVDKLTFVAQLRKRISPFGLTGHQLVGALFSDKTFSSLDQRLDDIIGGDIKREDNTWAVFYNFDQFLYEPEPNRGIGLFGRFGASDGNPNPMHYFASVGFGGTGMLSGRPHDRLGIGYYYIDIRNPTLQGPVNRRSALRDEHGFEVFYNIAITPWMMLTPDLQVLRGAQEKRTTGKKVHTATTFGFRVQILL